MPPMPACLSGRAGSVAPARWAGALRRMLHGFRWLCLPGNKFADADPARFGSRTRFAGARGIVRAFCHARCQAGVGPNLGFGCSARRRRARHPALDESRSCARARNASRIRRIARAHCFIGIRYASNSRQSRHSRCAVAAHGVGCTRRACACDDAFRLDAGRLCALRLADDGAAGRRGRRARSRSRSHASPCRRGSGRSGWRAVVVFA